MRAKQLVSNVRVWMATLAAIWLTPSSLLAQPLLHPVDTFRGVPFNRAAGLVLSSDGAFLYAGHGAAGLSVFRRGTAGEPLERLVSYFPSERAGALDSVGHFLTSPDEAHIYVGSDSTGVLAVLARNPQTGLLTSTQTLISGEAGLPVFSIPTGLAFSPLGDFLYVGQRSPASQRVLVFERSLATGSLSFVQDIAPPAAVSTEFATEALAMSPDGDHLYVLGDPLASVFERHPGTGHLSFVDAVDVVTEDDLTLVSAFAGTVSADGATLYLIASNACSTSNCHQVAIAALGRDPSSGRLELLEIVEESSRQSLGALTTSPDGRHLYVPDSDLDYPRIATFAPRADGRLDLVGEIVGQLDLNFGQVAAMSFDRGGRELYVSRFEGRPLSRLDRDPETGALSFEPPTVSPAEVLNGASDVVASPGGEHLYVASSSGAAIASFVWRHDTGTLEAMDAVFTPDLGVRHFDRPTGLRMSPDGRRLYAFDEQHSLLAFARQIGGSLDLVASFDSEGALGTIQNLAISPDGAALYLLGRTAIAVLSRDPPTDVLTVTQVFDDAQNFRHFSLSTDGKHLYALADAECGPSQSCLAMLTLERDPVGGQLIQRDVLFGLREAPFEALRSVVVSPDGRHLYLNTIRGAVPVLATFARDPSDGSLELTQVVADNQPSPNLNFFNRQTSITPDGRHLYIPRSNDRALVVFERDLPTGSLTFVEVLDGEILDSGALFLPEGLAYGPDSQLIHVLGAGRSAITTFSRRCLPGATACAGENRFRIDATWRDFANRGGAASHLDPLGDSSRIFWFFDDNNWEMLVKVLDGCAINNRQWVFAAATTDVETSLAVTDTWTGQRRTYLSSLGEAAPAVTDTTAFATCDADPPRTATFAAPPGSRTRPSKATCDGDPGLCISERFDVEVQWRDAAGQTGFGHRVPLDSESSGVLWFFDDDNWEMLVKVLDGCAVNNRVWVFAAATTDVATTLTVTDRVTGEQRVYEKPLGVAAPAVTDTDAFAACDGS